ncbi:MAG: large repetitive protein, partial [Actinomycetota bacterium]|nr:large repetitive protein [Actinomycetota bacterium]
MGAARRLVSARLAGLVVLAGGMLLAAPAAGLAAGWSPTVETVGGSSSAPEVASSFDASTNLTAIWPGATAVDSAVRTTSWPASAEGVGGASGAMSPDLAIGGDTSVAAWIDSGSNLNVSVRSGVGAWSTPASLSTGVASSPQVAIVGITPTVFWLDDGVVESATFNGVSWNAATAPSGTPPTGQISRLRVSVDSTGSGIAAWVDGVNVDTAVITAGSWAVDAGSLSTSADVNTTVAVAVRGSVQAVAWSEATNGVQVAVSTGSGLTVEAAATNAAAGHPALGFDSTGRLFAAYLNGSTVTAEIRDTTTGWDSEKTLGAGAAVAPSVAGDGSGDVAVTWVGVSALQMRAFDATPPDVTINAPTSLTPGTHTWSVTTSDLWSKSGGSTSWSFSDGQTRNGDVVTHDEPTPGPVTATATRDDGVGNITIVSETITIVPVAPTNSGLPAISAGGSLVSGTQLTAEPGTWSGNPTPTLTEQWQRCASSVSCTAIPSATGTTYTLTSTDVGFKIRVEEMASNSGGSPSADSATTAVVGPVATGKPTMTATASAIADGVTLTAHTVASNWGGAGNLSFTYRFQRCNGSCSTVQESGLDAYTVGPSDVGSTIRVSVVATAGPVDGDLSVSATLTSDQTDIVAPEATSAPSVTGVAQDGKQLTASSPAADWDGVANLTQSYQFYRCDASGGGCLSVGVVSSSPSYVLSLDDIGSTIKVIAFASKNGSSISSSDSSAASAIIGPTSTSAPAAPTGGAQDGQQLTASTGSWLNQAHLSFKYQYFRCSPSCAPVGPQSDSAAYVLQPGDVGNTIQVAVTAYIGSGTTVATSSHTLAIAPLNTGVSSITAPAQQQDGQTYTASDGAWDGATGLAFGYQWKRCDSSGSSCTAIQGATGKTYTSGPLDVGQTLRALVSAVKGGSATTLATGDSAQTGVVAARNTALPSTSGIPMDGKVLTADTAGASAGSWDGVANLTYAYQWLRCDGSGNTCVAIATNGTGSTYMLTPDDVAAPGDATHARITIRVQISATLNGASTAANSNATPQIAAAPTVNTTLPAVSGDPIENQELTASAGAWSGTDVHVVSYQWVRCDPPFATCTNDGVASLSGRYLVQTADVGHYVTFVETVANRLGTTSTQRAVVGKPVVSNVLGATDAPLVTPATYVDGTALSTSDGVWLPADHLTFTYQWLRCPGSIDTTADDSSSCSWIPSASS